MIKMMKNLIALIIISLLFSPAYATQLGSQELAEIDFSDSVVTQAEVDVANQTFADPGIAPDSPFYFLKKFSESLRFMLASKEDKAKLRLEFAKTRLAEARFLMNKNKINDAIKFVAEYENEINRTEEEINRTRGLGKNVSAIARDMEDVLLKSALVLELVKQKAPDEAKPALERAINKSLEKRVRIKIKSEDFLRVKKRVTIVPATPSELRGETIPMPPTREQIIEAEIRNELEKERERHRERVESLIKIEISGSGSSSSSSGSGSGLTGITGEISSGVSGKR